MANKTLTCPKCSKGGFGSPAALKGHIRTKHPEAPVPKEVPGIASIKFPENTEPGYHSINCPTCRQPATVYLKDDGTVASSSEVPKPPPTSGLGGKHNPIKRAAHPEVISARYKMRWNAKENRWKRTVCLSGTHGKTGIEIPWQELGIDEFWMLNDCHGVMYIQPYIEKVSRWFQIHHRWRITRRWSRASEDRVVQDHWQWLKQSMVPRIVMQRKFREIPHSETFPFREVCEMFLKGYLGRGAGYTQHYFTNTFSYMLAQIAYEKAKGIKDWERIELYGCELEQIETEFIRQRPGIEFWFGMLVNMGVEIYVPESCFMLYPQVIGRLPTGQQFMANAPGYTAYGYKSPSLEEARAEGQPLGTDPIEENIVGSWDDYDYIDHTYTLNEAIARITQAHTFDLFSSENDALNEFLEEFNEHSFDRG